MAYANFKPTVWSKKIQRELEKLCVMQEDCNTQWQGEVGVGKRVGARREGVFEKFEKRSVFGRR